MNIHRFAESLRREAQAWARALRHVDDEAEITPGDQLFSSQIGSGETTFTAAFALSRLLIALGRFSSVQTTFERLWPADRSLQTGSQSSAGGEDHAVKSVHELIPGLARKLQLEPALAIRLFREMLLPVGDGVTSDRWEDVYNNLCEWRLAVIASSIEGLQVDFAHLGVMDPEPQADAQVETLNPPSRRALEAAVRGYLAYEWICTWAHRFERARRSHGAFERRARQSYEPFARVLLATQMEGSVRGQSVDDLMEGVLPLINRHELGDFAGIIREIFQSLSGMLGDWGLEHTIDALEGGAAPWSDSGSSPSGRGVNVIPSEAQGSCQAVLLALAASRRRSGDLKAILRQVRAHLINCIQQCRVVLLVTDHWDMKHFDESALDLRAHSARGIVFIPILVTGRNMRILDLDIW